jgi:hypothetical protein
MLRPTCAPTARRQAVGRRTCFWRKAVRMRQLLLLSGSFLSLHLRARHDCKTIDRTCIPATEIHMMHGFVQNPLADMIVRASRARRKGAGFILKRCRQRGYAEVSTRVKTEERPVHTPHELGRTQRRLALSFGPSACMICSHV